MHFFSYILNDGHVCIIQRTEVTKIKSTDIKSTDKYIEECKLYVITVRL